MDDHQLYFFGLSGDAAELSFQAEKELRVRDLIEAKPQSDGSGTSTIQLKYPVCFDCFDLIIGGINTKIGKQEKLRDTYMTELLKIEQKIDKLNKEDPSALEAELRILEAEEAELDR